MDTAEAFRRKARKLMKSAHEMGERGMDQAGTITIVGKALLQEEYDDAAGEAQALQFEAREMVNRIGENRAMGLYHFFGLLGA